MEIPVMVEPLSSPSPELGMENIEDHSRISPEHAPPKKRGRRISLGAEKFLQCLREGVVESLRGIYESKHEEVDIVNSMKQLKITFNRAIKANSERPKRVFFDELGFRLDFMMESTAYLDARLRVLKMVSKLAIIIQRDANNVEFIDFLVNYCEELCFCDEAAVRQNVCSLIGFLFSASSSFAKDTSHVMSFNYRKRLYVLIRKRQLDKIVNVRAEVIRAVLAIQDDEIASDFKEALERSPKDIILMGLRDIAFECRLAAVQSLSVAVHAQLEGLVDLAMGDKYSRVRIGAICRLGKLPLRLFTAEQKINLLYATLSDADQTIREAGHKLLLSEWLDSIVNLRTKKSKKSNTLEQYDYGLGTAAQTLLGQLDFAESYETRKSARIILFASFDIIRKRLSLENEMLSDFVTALANDRTKPEIISRSNYKIILNRKLSTVNQACYAFFWHSLVKYCSEKAKNEPDKLECMHRLAVTLSAMCGVIKKLITHDQLEKMDDSQEVQDILKMKQITVLETLEILRHLDRDTSGMLEWKNLLESLLSDCSLSKEVTDRIMIDLAETFYSSRADDLLSAVCEITAGVVHKVYNPDATLANETVSLPLNMTLRPIEMPELDEVTLHFCMQLTHSLLRTGIFNKFNALLRGVYDNVIDKCWSSTSAKVRVWALEAVAIIGMIDEDIARGKLPVIVEALSIDEIQVKMGCLDILADLIIVHNYEKVMSWYSTADVETNRVCHLIYYFVDIIKDTVADYSLCIKGCECACKILLAEPRGFKNKHWVDTVTSLIMRLCHPSASKNTYLKGCLAQFFPIFCTINRLNQLLLLSGFHNMLAEVRISDTEDSFVAKVDIERATLFIINLTRFSVLQETAPGKNEGPVHRVLLSDILAYLSDHPEDGFVRIYCQATALLELDGIPLDEITNMQQGYQSLLDTFVDIVGSRSKSVTELKKLIRRIDTARKALNSKHIEDSEMDDAVCELPVISTLHTPIKTRKTPLSTSTPGTSKYKSRRKKMQSTTKKSVRQEAEEILASPYSPRNPSMSELHLTTRARPKLARLAKKEAIRPVGLFRD